MEARSCLPGRRRARRRSVWVARERRSGSSTSRGGARTAGIRRRELRQWAAPEQAGFLAPLRGGGFIAGLKSGLYRFDPQSSEFVHLTSVEPDRPDNRLNDGSVSPEGELWFGSMDDPESEPSGALYRLDRDGRCVVLDKGYVITNGPAFSPDGHVFYHTATSRIDGVCL